MFILYSIVLGLPLGLLLGGRVGGLAAIQIRWSWLIVVGLLAQVVLFSDAVASRMGGAGAAVYVGSTVLVAVVVLRNMRITGMPIVAAGALCNLAAILANGGYMPASREALGAAGKIQAVVYSNSALLEAPALAPLSDIFALPAWLPWSNIFSVGDVLIGAGVVVVIVQAMRNAPRMAAPGASAH